MGSKEWRYGWTIIGIIAQPSPEIEFGFGDIQERRWLD
jgi:hypothetical protein